MMQQTHKHGCRHPISLLRQRIEHHFIKQGFSLIDGPEVEAAWFHFDALNIHCNHFARSPEFTFFINNNIDHTQHSDLVLRAHTSPMQIRVMLEQSPPLYKIGIGRVFRPDAVDETHSPVFNQLEGLVVDKNLTVDDLKQTLSNFATFLFGEQVVTRFRTYEFAYATSAFEIDVQCTVCRALQPNCPTCQGEGWIEWGGCGLVHPNVLANCGVDQNTYTAFSFGIGVERTLMLQSGLLDLRQIVNGDINYICAASKAPVTNHTSKNISDVLAVAGFIETTSFPFVDHCVWDYLGLAQQSSLRNTVNLYNPIKGQGSSLCTSLLPGLLDTLQRNMLRGVHMPSIFEHARVFHPSSSSSAMIQLTPGKRPSDNELHILNAAIPNQPQQLAAISVTAQNWQQSVEIITKAVLIANDLHLRTSPALQAPWMPDKSVSLWIDDILLGHAGQLHPEVISAFKLPINPLANEPSHTVVAMVINLTQLNTYSQQHQKENV